MKIVRIGIVGCGTIGSKIAQTIEEKFNERAKLTALYDSDLEKAYKLESSLKRKKIAVLSLNDLLKIADLVIEASSADAAFEIAKNVISCGKDILIMSTGGIVECAQELFNLARQNNARIYIPSGAVCGLDGIKAASLGKINKATLTTRKPPKALMGSKFILKNKINLETIKEETVIFEGPAGDAIKLFPQNINVAATLSLAGIGLENTVVRIVTSPRYVSNIHEIEIEADSGRIFCRAENVPSPDNPKTSFLAILSALAMLDEILGNVKIGT